MPKTFLFFIFIFLKKKSYVLDSIKIESSLCDMIKVKNNNQIKNMSNSSIKVVSIGICKVCSWNLNKN